MFNKKAANKISGIIGIILAAVILFSSACPQAAAESVNDYSNGSVVKFGSYPQTLVSDEDLIAQLNGDGNITDGWFSYGYYTDGAVGDYMKYKDVEYSGEKYRGVFFSSYRPEFTNSAGTEAASLQDNNGYTAGTVYWFKYEPLKWKILDAEKGLLLCESIIDATHFYHQFYANTDLRSKEGKTVYHNNYEFSEVRAWLNGDFYNAAFSSDEKGVIASTELNNDAWLEAYSQYNADETVDNVFLLSCTDVRSYGFKNVITSDSTRRKRGTDYAKCQGLIVISSTQTSYWRLRSAGTTSTAATHISYDGSVGNCSGVFCSSEGICPAVCVNLKSDDFNPGECEHIPSDLIIDVKPTCLDSGTAHKECVNCGRTIERQSVEKLSHSYTGTPKYVDEQTHTYLCVNGCKEYGNPTAHTPTTVTGYSATCTAAGKTNGKYCNACGTTYVKQEIIPPLGHNISYKSDNNATCTVDGTKTGKCSRNGCKLAQTVTDTGSALGHSFNYVSDNNATCTQDGTKTAACGRDGCEEISTITDTGSMKEHTYDRQIVSDTYKVTAATCTAKATYYYSCVCGAKGTETFESGETLGHTEVTDEAAAPDCTNTGLTEGKSCLVCEAVLVAQESVDALGHTEVIDKAVAPTCTKAGLTQGKHCSVCGAVITAQKTVKATGHKPVTDKAAAATCTKTGKTAGSHCSVCGTVITAQKTVKATGHTYKTTVTPATLSKAGKTVVKCTVCGDVKSSTAVAKIKSVTLADASVVYSGKVQKVTVVVKDNNGKTVAATNYTVTYKNNTNVGKATVTVTFKGNYSGTKTLNFNILPKGTTITKVTSTKKAVANATIKKQAAQITGYEIQYSTSKNFKNAKTVKITKNTTTAAAISKLTGGKTYYFRIRTYKTVSKVNYYSAWSTAASVRVK